jgi:hypothetical protein
MKPREIEALAERLLARSPSRLSCDQPELQRDLKMAAALIARWRACLTWTSMSCPPGFPQHLWIRSAHYDVTSRSNRSPVLARSGLGRGRRTAVGHPPSGRSAPWITWQFVP